MSKKDIALSSGFKSVVIDGERQLRIIATAPTLDRDLEVIDTETIKVPVKPRGLKYASELTVDDEIDVPFLIDHNWALEKQAGYIKSMEINAIGELEAVVQLANVDNGDRVYQLAKDGALNNSFSIGFTLQNATDEDGVIKNIELTEISAVFKGSNRDARLLEVKSVKEEKSMSKLEQSEKATKVYLQKVKGLVADIVGADSSWETEDKKWDIMKPVSELYWALQEAWYFSATPIESFESLLNEFNQLVESVINGTYDEKSVELSDELRTVLKGKTAEDVRKAVESLRGETKTTDAKKAEEAEEQAETAEATEEVEAVEEEVKSIKKETKEMTDVESKSIVEAPVKVEQHAETKSFDKVDHAAKQFMAYLNNDAKALAELNKEAMETYAGKKETYLNAGTSADGGAIVPSAQLLSDIYSTLDTFSGIANDIRVITLTEGDSLDIATLVQDVVVKEVALEGGAKEVTKPELGDDNVAVREFAGITVITKKLVRQAAINIYEILRESYARAIARKRAELILTDASSGIINKTTGIVPTAGALPTWAEVKKAPYNVPTSAVAGAKYYISREALEALDSEVSGVTGVDLDVVTLDGPAGLTGRFKNGFQFVVEESLGGVNPHVVFGNFGRFGILLRQGVVESETFNTGIVTDSDSTDHNLLQENKLAQRVAFYENVGFPAPLAFAVYQEGTSS